MSYKIFLSYSTQESELAEFIRNALNNAFKNKIEFAFNNIRGGEKWKEMIQKSLNDSDAILTILTPKYLQRPWAYIEWASFWLKDKTTYVLVTDDIEMKDIVDPMKDTQCTRMFNENDIIKLFEILSEKCNTNFIPYDSVNLIVNKSKAIYDKVLTDYERSKYSIYKNASELLPNDDFKKVEILWYFYDKEFDKNAVAEVFQSINDNSIKGNILLKFLEKNELEIIENVFESVESKSNLLPLLKGLIESGHENSELLEKILMYLAGSQPTLRSFCEYLIRNRKTESKALLNSIPLFTNRAELRKLGECLIDNSYVTNSIFDIVVQHFYGFSHAELQKLLKYAMNDNNFNKIEMKEQIIKLAGQNQREAEKVLYDLLKKDKALVLDIVYNMKVFTNSEILKRIEEQLKTNSE